MVFESVVADVLNKILGDYIQNLDHKQLKIGIWGGDVVLHNLKLRENALDDLDLPIQLIYGSLGKLVLNIPWKNLYSQPVVAQIEDLYILVSPKQSVQYNADKEEKYVLDAKLAQLQKIADAKRQELEKDKPKPDKGFTEKLTAQIVNNLQVKISNVHVRYEDVTTTGKPFSFGITLHNLELYTTDVDWNKSYITEQVSKVFKVADLNSLSAYMNCKNANLFTNYDVTEYPKLFETNIAYEDYLPNSYNYMIGPISSIAKLKLNMNPQYDDPPFEAPKIDLYLEMQKLKIGITNTQFLDIMKLGDAMNRLQLGAPYRKYRPFNIPYKGHYKTWWHFAITSILEEDVRRRQRNWSWTNMQTHRKLLKTYAKAFKEKELSKKSSANLIETCNLCEKKLDLFNLILVRNQVHLEIDKIKQEEKNVAATNKGGWLSSWWYGSSKQESESDSANFVKKFEAAMTSQEKQKLYEAIGYQESSNEFSLPESYEAIQMNFKLVALEVGLYDNIKSLDELNTVMLLNFSMATAEVYQRPAANSIKLIAGMKELKLTGYKKNDFAPTIIESIVTDEYNLLDVFFETNPLDKKCDQRLKISARPLQLIYDSATILSLVETFSPPKSLNFSELEGAASQGVSNFKERTATGIYYMVEKHAILEVNINFMPNILIIPKNGIYIPGVSPVIVISLGRLSISTEPRPTSEESRVSKMHSSGASKDQILQHMMQHAYDKFKIAIEDCHILVAKPKEKWQDALSEISNNDMHILRPISIIISADLCLIDDDPRLPKTKIGILVPSIHINLTEDRIFEAINVVTSIPLPENQQFEPKPLTKYTSTDLSHLSISKLLENKSKRAPLKEDIISEEIVQYTSLELSFALKEFGITLFAALRDDDADTPSYRTPVEELLPAERESSILSPNIEKEKLLDLKIMLLEAKMVQKTYELVATVRLGAIRLLQSDNYMGGESILPIIDTPRFTNEMEYLLTISYLNGNKSSPEFNTKYNSTEQLITIHFSTLVVILHQECLQKLLHIANGLQMKLEQITKNMPTKDRVATSRSNEGIIMKLGVIEEEQELITNQESDYQSTSSCSKGKVVDSIKLKVLADMHQVSVQLTCRKRPIANLQIKKFHTGLVLKSSYTEISLKLKNIMVTDLNPKTIHSKVLSIIGENALKCQVVMYNLDNTSDYNSDDIKIDVTMGCVKIIFLNWFITSVLTFMNNFQTAQEAIAGAAKNAGDAAAKNVVDAYGKATRMKLNIKIKAPILVLPIHSASLEGISLDLGFINLTNVTSVIKVSNNKSSPAVIDDIKLELKDFKLSKVTIIPTDKSSQSVNEDVTDYGLKSTDVYILDPISFILNVKRNLSSSWFKDHPDIDVSGRLRSIELNLYVEDYILLMSILNKNLAEGQNEFPQIERIVTPPQETPNQLAAADVHTSQISSKTTTSKSKTSAKPVENINIGEQLKFNFQFDGVIANFINEDHQGLATFGIHFLSLKGNKLADETMSVSIVLCDVRLDDKRPGSKSKITKYLTRKENDNHRQQVISKEGNADKTDPIKYMVDVVAILKENDIFAEVRVCGFDLIISIDFLLKISQFFTLPEESKMPLKYGDSKQITPVKSHLEHKKSTAVTPEKSKSKIRFILHLDEPDIILVESLEDVNTNAIVFNCVMNLNYRVIEDKQIIYGEITQLKMFMCAFALDRREQTMHFIIHPCSITLQGSTPEEKGLHISLKASEIIVNISPATIELINKAITTVTTSTGERTLALTEENDYSEIWDIQQYTERDFWFIKTEKGIDVLELSGSLDLIENKPEKCIIEVPSICLVIESGLGYYTSPMLCIETKMNATVSDWSKQMSVEGNLTLSMNYFNSSLAVWEPFIEENERLNKNKLTEHGPWELRFGLDIDSKNIEVDEAKTRIKIESDETLELTMTKTSYELLMALGEAFSQALYERGLQKPEVTAPFVCENDTGFDITLDFTKGIFTMHESHITGRFNESLNQSLLFKSNDLHEVNPSDVKICTVSPGGKVYLKTKFLCDVLDPCESEYNLHVTVGGIKKEVILPVSKADKRFFPLYRDTNQEPWGIISEVKSVYGTTNINIHGVVSVYNHFSTNVSIYRNDQKSGKILVGEVAPGEEFHVPLHSIYAPIKELYFSLPGYNCSVQGIKWNDCLTDMQYTRQIQCDPINTYEPFYINAIREKTEVFHETTSKFTILSAYYTFHLRPPLYLCNALPIGLKVSVSGCSVRQDAVPKALELNEDNSKSLAKEDFLDYGEKDIKPGDVLHLPTVKLTTKTGEAKSFIVVRLVQYLEKDWSCTTEISEYHNEFVIWTFSSFDSVEKMDLELGVRFENRHGSLMLTIYSPFWMINKTGLTLSYRTNSESVNVLYHPPEYNGPILFSFREKHFFDKKRSSIRVDNGEWSEKIPLDVAGSVGDVLCKANDMTYQIGVHNHLTQNSLTKQITFIPFHVAINKCDFAIEVQENNRPADPWVKINPDECVPIWPKADTNNLLVARIAGDNQKTVPFKYTEFQSTLLKLNKNKAGGINVDVQTTEGGIYITFTQYNIGDAPCLLINHTKHTMKLWEKANPDKITLQPNEKILFTWADPAGEKKLLWHEALEEDIESDLRKDGVGRFRITKTPESSAYWVSFLDGLQRVLLFTEKESIATSAESSSDLQQVNQEIEICIHGIGLSVLNNINGNDLLYLGITSSGVIWESKKKGKKRFKQMKIAQTNTMEAKYQEFLNDQEVGDENKYYLDSAKQEINFKNMTLFKGSLRNVQRSFYPGVWIQLKTSPYQTQLHAKINRVQIDNQLSDCIFPVILAPIPPPKSVAATTALKPFVEVSVVQRVVPNSAVKQFKYCSMLIQEFAFKVDLLFLTAVAEMFATEMTDEQMAKLFNGDLESIAKPLSDLVATHSMQEQKHFYDNLHLGPLKIQVSFSMAGAEPTALPGILSTIIQGVGVTLTDVNDVVFKLAFFERGYQFFTQQQLISEITQHYTGQALKQLYVLVLGLDVLGNPYGLVVGLTKGVEDLFYEPFQGAVQGPGEFAEGLVLGVKSLFGHTVGGAAGAVSKITGAMGKGLAALTFDEDYQKKRRQALNKKPANFQEGIARSGKGLVMGVFDGVTGVFTKPISGAKEEGVEGFFKGLGKGAVGLVARPTAGVVDFASGSFDAVKRATDNVEDVTRLRPPRFLRQDNVVRPYSRMESEGNKLLKEIEKGKYATTDIFSHSEEVEAKQKIILLSNHRIIQATKNDLFGHWAVHWTYRWAEILGIKVNAGDIELTLKKEGKKVLGLFSSSENQKKIIPMPNKSKREKLAELIEELKTMEQYN